MNPIVDLVLRATFLLAIGYLGWRALAKWSAEGRCVWLRAVLTCLLILPVLVILLPKVSFVMPWVPKPEPLVVDAQLLSAMPEGAIPRPQPGIGGLVVGWLAVAFLAAIPTFFGWRVLIRRWRSGRALSADEQHEVESAFQQMGISRQVPTRVGCASSPLVFGAMKPRMLLPKGFFDWPESYRRSALLHEAAHVRRFDCAWLMLAAFARAVYICHPLVWWLSRALRDETELAADERAIRTGVDATDYASALVAIARDLQVTGRLVRSQGVTFMHHRQLENRVRQALGARRRGFALPSSLAVAFAALASTFALSTVRPHLPQQEIVVQGVPLQEIVVQGVPIQEMPIAPVPARETVERRTDTIVVARPAQRGRSVPKVRSSAPAVVVRRGKRIAPPAQVARVGVPVAPQAAVAPTAPTEIAVIEVRGVLAPTAPQATRSSASRPAVAPSVTLRSAPAQLATPAPLEAQGFSEADAKHLRQMVEKAISEARKAKKEVEVKVGMPVVPGSLFEGYVASPKFKEIPAIIERSMGTVPNAEFAKAMEKSMESRRKALEGAEREFATTLRRDAARAATDWKEFKWDPELDRYVLGRAANPIPSRQVGTGESKIVVTDDKGNTQVIVLKPGKKGTIRLHKDKDGKIRVID